MSSPDPAGAAPPATPPASARSVPCPTCGLPALFAAANRWRPFCSERCRQADLGAWASERFRVAGPPAGQDLPNDTD